MEGIIIWKTLLPIIVQVITGIIGGQAVGAALKTGGDGCSFPKFSAAPLAASAARPSSAACSAAVRSIRRPRRARLGSALNLHNIVGGVGGGAILTGIVGAVMGAMKK